MGDARRVRERIRAITVVERQVAQCCIVFIQVFCDTCMTKNKRIDMQHNGEAAVMQLL